MREENLEKRQYSLEKTKAETPEEKVEMLKKNFLSNCTSYELAKKELQQKEKEILKSSQNEEIKAELISDREQLIQAIKAVKESFLPIISQLMSDYGKEKTFDLLKNWIAEKAGSKKYIEDWTEFGRKMVMQSINILYNSTISLLEQEGPTRTPSPYEAILSSIRLREIGSETAELVKEHAESFCMSGSSSWGAFFSTRGQVSEDPFEYETKVLREMKLISDVDMIVIIENPEKAKLVVEALVKKGRLKEKEIERVNKFCELYSEGKTDMFSCRGDFGNIEQSFHIITKDVLSKMLSYEEKEKTIPVVKDFRPDKPGSFKKYGGYPILGLEGRQIALLKKEPVPVDESDPALGFLSESPSGGPMIIEDDGEEIEAFALGIVSTQLLYQPDILFDQNGFLREKIDALLKAIAQYLPNEEIFNVPRWERMPASFKEKLLKELYKKKDIK